MRIIRTTLVLTAIAVLGGCYRWVPTEQAAVPPGAEVKATLTDVGVEEMRRYLGPDVTSVEGPMVSWDPGGLSILSVTTLRRAGFPPTVLTDTLRLAPNYTADVAIRELDGKRTAIFTAGALGAAAGAVMAALIFGGNSESPGEGDGPPPEESVVYRIPLFSIPFRLGIW
jgi:hypothetical protein